MPATRLLLIADSKMLPALANGLREGSRFDVLTVPWSDSAGAQAAAEKADAVALFYGAPGAPLPAALQSLAGKVRDRGGRLVAVLQREQAAQRDDCFRAGASDLIFMPMPKDQFVARLQGSLELSFAQEGGASAPVAVATRTASSRVDAAKVSAAGVEASAELPLKPGETVRLSWGAFQSWGLVVRGGPSAQIRFAGLAPDEETQIHDWLKKGAAQAATSPAVATPAAAAASAAATQSPESASAPVAATRAAPAGGPPPGFADRRPVRPQTRPAVRMAPPAISARGAPAPAPGDPEEHAGGPALFADGAAPAAGGAQPPLEMVPAPAGPPWPVPSSPAACKAVAMQLFKDKMAQADAAPGLLAAARKVTGSLGSAERAALDKGGPDSPLADAIAARVALDAATLEGVKLYSSSPSVDAAAVAALTKQADEAAARLQKEANAAVGKGEVETLQMVTAASAALSRDLLTFRETADRLRGQGAAPRLGAGALDPDVVLPGQAPRPAPAKGATTPAPVRAELRDFQNLDGKSGRGKNVFMVLVLVAFAVALANALYFGVPREKQLTPESAGKGVARIEVAGPSALVTVTPEWVESATANLPQLLPVLREAEVKKAILVLPNGSPAGVLDVTTGKASGLPGPKVISPTQ